MKYLRATTRSLNPNPIFLPISTFTLLYCAPVPRGGKLIGFPQIFEGFIGQEHSTELRSGEGNQTILKLRPFTFDSIRCGASTLIHYGPSSYKSTIINESLFFFFLGTYLSYEAIDLSVHTFFRHLSLNSHNYQNSPPSFRKDHNYELIHIQEITTKIKPPKDSKLMLEINN